MVVEIFLCNCGSLLIPRAALAPKKIQYLQVTTVSCIKACPFIPRAALSPEPPQCLQVTALAGISKDVSIQLEALLGFQPLQGLQLASARCEEEKGRNKSEANTKKEDETVKKKKTHLHPR